MSTLRLAVDPREAVAGAKQAESALDKVATQALRTEAATKRASRGFSGFGFGVRNASYQIADVAVQMQYGVSAMRAMSMQLPQLLAGFGVFGAIAGAVAAVGAGIMSASSGTRSLSFDFKQLGQDIGPALAPLKTVWEGIKTAFGLFKDGLVWGVNAIINSVQYMVAVVGAVPDAFKAGLEKASSYVRAFGLDVQSMSYSVQGSLQAMMDALTPGEAKPGFLAFLDEESGYTAAENFKFMAQNLSNQATLMRTVAGESAGAFDTLKNAIDGVTQIDIRDYFKTATEAAKETGDTVGEVADKMDDLAKKFEDSMTSGFMSIIDGTKSAKDAFRDMARDIIAELYRVLVVKQLVGSWDSGTGSGTGLVGMLMGGLGGLFGRASGGPVDAGKPYIVGERGPEVFTPTTNGRISNGGGGAVTVNQTINITTGVQQTVRAEIMSLAPRLAEQAKMAVLDAKRRGGSFGAAF